VVPAENLRILSFCTIDIENCNNGVRRVVACTDQSKKRKSFKYTFSRSIPKFPKKCSREIEDKDSKVGTAKEQFQLCKK